MITTIPQLIEEYLRAASEITSRMAAAYGVENIWRAYVNHEIPQRGPVSPVEGGDYRFHGVGCHLKSGDIDIEIDFGPEGGVEGFDAYRLVHFARHTLGSREFDLKAVKQELARMYEQGEVTRIPDWNDSLYFLPEPVESRSPDSQAANER